MVSQYRIRLPLMVLGGLSLLAALWGGLARLGWGLPTLQPTLLITHGPLMVSGFLGTLIGVERAVALGHRWAYVAPLLTGVGALALITGLSDLPGPLLMTLGSLGLVFVFIVIIYRQLAFFTVITGLGALLWLGGNSLWLIGWPIYRIVFWWIGFLLLTIVGEQLEMSRLLRFSQRKQGALVLAISLFLAGLVLVSVDIGMGESLAGGGMVMLALWLLHYDIARHTIWKAGLPRFIAVSLLSGYVWLGVSGIVGLLYGGVVAGPRYDALLHAFFLGFVFAMIFGHAPVIFPAVLGVSIPFHPTFYTHLILLHVSLLLRLVGDLTGWLSGRQWGGLLNGISLLLFLANTMYAAQKLRYKA